MWLSRRGRALSSRADGSTGQDPKRSSTSQGGPPPRRESLPPLLPTLPLLSERSCGVLSLPMREHCSKPGFSRGESLKVVLPESLSRQGRGLPGFEPALSVFPLPGGSTVGVGAATQVAVIGSLLHSWLASCLPRVFSLESQDFVAHGL